MRAIVTGATGAIGNAIVGRLAESGYTVIAIGTNRDGLTPHHRVFFHALDLTDDAAIGRACDDLTDPLDVLIHGAGALCLNPIPNASLQCFDRQYRINVRAPFQLTQALLPCLRASQGQVVFLNSTVGLKASAHGSQYGASKHALRAIADSLRDEVNADSIRVLSVFLGRTASRMQAEVCRREGKPYRPESLIQPDDVAQVVLAALALPRTAEITDLSIRPCRKPAA